MVTGSDGSFAYDNVPARLIYLEAAKPDYMVIWAFRTRAGDQQATYLISDHTGPILLRLAPGAAITGILRDHQGVPIVKGASISLWRHDNWEGWPRLVYIGSPEFGADGTYHFSGLLPGRYHLVARPFYPKYPARYEAEHAVAEVPVRYPASTAQNSEPFFTLREGEQTHIDFHFQEEILYRVTVTGDPEPPGMIVDANGSSYHLERLSDGKHFEARLPNGTYRLTNGREWEISGPMPSEVRDSDLSDLHFTIAPPNSTSVAVPIEVSSISFPPAAGPDGYKLCGSGVMSLLHFLSDGNISVDTGFSVDAGLNCVHSQHPNQVSMFPGIYRIAFRPEANLYAKSITSGATDLAVEQLVVRPGATPQPIRVVLAEGASVEGIVHGNGKASRAYVYALAEDIETKADFRIFEPVLSGEDGKFIMTGLAPGSYLFFASDVELALNVHDPSETAYWRSHGKIALVQAGKTTKLALTSVDPPDEP